MRKPFKRNLNEIKIEDAHGGSGRRQVLLSKKDPIASQMDAMTKGFLPPYGVFDWHKHENVDEFFLVLQGNGIIEFENNSTIKYRIDDIIYIPANTNHRIENLSDTESVFYFVRVNQ